MSTKAADGRVLDRARVTIVADNECDALSSPGAHEHRSEIVGIIESREPEFMVDDTTPGIGVFDALCFACHGYSALVTGWIGDEESTILFDVGPDADLWLSNAAKLRVSLEKIEAVFLSHWHWDHSGGFARVVAAITEARASHGLDAPVVDLHPERPNRRGLRHPAGHVLLLPEDPTIAELEATGATVRLLSEAHELGSASMFRASGEIPRQTAFETGLIGHVSDFGDGFIEDATIADERCVSFTVAGRGTSVLSACSHAGIVNASNEALTDTDHELDVVFGGYHLSGLAMEKRIDATIAALGELNPNIVAPGHCTGWRAKHALAAALPDHFAPSVVGSVYQLN